MKGKGAHFELKGNGANVTCHGGREEGEGAVENVPNDCSGTEAVYYKSPSKL